MDMRHTGTKLGMEEGFNECCYYFLLLLLFL